MTLNASGPISLGGATTGQSINLELGVSATALASINSTDFRTLANVASGQISLSNFYGKSNVPAYFLTYRNAMVGAQLTVGTNSKIYSVGGFYYSCLVYSQQGFVGKFNSNGTVVWMVQTNTIPSTSNTSSVVDSSGNVYLINGVSGSFSFNVTKINSSGAIVLQKSVTTPCQSPATTAATIDSSNNIYVAGSGSGNPFVCKFDSTITVAWSRQGISSTVPASLGLDLTQANLYMGASNGRVYKINSSTGATVQNWTVSIGASSLQCNIQGILFDSSNNLYTAHLAPSSNNIVIAKTAQDFSSGSWVRTSPFFYYSITGMTVDTSGNVLVGGAYANGNLASLSGINSSGTNTFNNVGASSQAGFNALYSDGTSVLFQTWTFQPTVGTLNQTYTTIYGRLPANGSGTQSQILGNSAWYYTPAGSLISWNTDSFSASAFTDNLATFSASTATSTSITVSSSTSPTNTAVTIPTTSGSTTFPYAGTYTWIAPAGVTKVSAAVISGGGSGAGGGGGGGGGGGIGYTNNITVVPGTGYTVVVGLRGVASGVEGYPRAGTNGGESSAINNQCRMLGGSAGYTTGGSGGAPSFYTYYIQGGTGGEGSVYQGGGGGGAVGGYRTTGGYGAYGGNTGTSPTSGSAGVDGGGGGGGGGDIYYIDPTQYADGGGYGGGVGLMGIGGNGAAGAGGVLTSGSPGGAGSYGFNGKNYGGGGGGGGANIVNVGTCCESLQWKAGVDGGGGLVRIIWPGDTRSFPSTNVGNP